jgi:rare lipoprotein A
MMVRPTALKAAPAALVLLLAACGSTPQRAASPAPVATSSRAPAASATTPGRKSPYAPAQEDLSKRGDYVAGGLYAPGVKDSAPPEIHDVDLIPEPEVRAEPRGRYGNRDYSVLGKRYHVLETPEGYVETGLASFYGNKFHGRRTSSLEVYDMYAFSAAHKTLPLPSFARVTNLSNGKSVIVRVNDRGPFHDGRVIDLSYAAAVKLGVHRAGTAKVEVRALMPSDARGPDMRVAESPAAPAAPPPSTLDRMIDALPIASADAGERKGKDKADAEVEPAPAGPWRFDMRQDGKTMTADEFDAWMKARQVRVATGKSATPVKTATPAASTRPEPARAPRAAEPAPKPVQVADRVDRTDGVVLQVASFAARGNAERALAMLEQAGVGGARLQDGTAAGQKVWRLRVGPVASDRVAELSATVAGLGFGRPNVVRD